MIQEDLDPTSGIIVKPAIGESPTSTISRMSRPPVQCIKQKLSTKGVVEFLRGRSAPDEVIDSGLQRTLGFSHPENLTLFPVHPCDTLGDDIAGELPFGAGTVNRDAIGSDGKRFMNSYGKVMGWSS